MKVLQVTTVLVVGSVLGAWGCSTSTAANVVEVQRDPDETRLIVGDPDFHDVIQIELTEVRMRFTDLGFLEAQATLVNLSSGTVRFEYMYKWFDKDGFEIEASAKHWTPDQIYGRDRLPIQGVAPDTRAQDFKVSVRRPIEQK